MKRQLAISWFSADTRRQGVLALCLALCTFGLGATASADQHEIKFFDAPGAGTNGSSQYSPQGTYVHQINFWGAIVGFVRGQDDVRHGFVRAPNGTFTMIDVKEAGGGPGQGTWATGINFMGVVTGYYADPNDVDHGYVRDLKGNVTTIDVPGSQYTWSLFINDEGTIAGYYWDANYNQHGFVRSPQGVIATVDPPDSLQTDVTDSVYGSALNDAGQITGDYWVCPNGCVVYGFVRASDGTYQTFSAPGAGTGESQGTFPQSIDQLGTVTGYYFDENYVYHGFVRAPNGTFTTIDAPGACIAGASCQFNGTNPFGINLWGVIAGQYSGEDGVNHSFWRNRKGDVTTFDAVHVGPWTNKGTHANSINFWGQIAGWVKDTTGVGHGFVMRP